MKISIVRALYLPHLHHPWGGGLPFQGSLFGARSLRDAPCVFPYHETCMVLCEEQGTRKATNETLSRRGRTLFPSSRSFRRAQPALRIIVLFVVRVTGISDDAWAAPSSPNMCVCVCMCMYMRARRHSQWVCAAIRSIEMLLGNGSRVPRGRSEGVDSHARLAWWICFFFFNFFISRLVPHIARWRRR